MATFAFRAVDVAGVPARGELDASSKAHVAEQLRQRGLIVLDVSEKREALKLESIFQRFKSVDMRALSVFSRQFATLISSGMPMLRALYTLEEQTEDEMVSAAVAGVRQDVEAGSGLSAAMESQPGVFNSHYRSMVAAGEGAGRLEEALDRISAQLEKLDALRRQVKGALMYPAVVFTLALLVMIAVVSFIVPVFVGIFEDIAKDTPGADTSLPLMTKITVGASDLVTGKWYILLPAVGIAAYLFLRWKKTEKGKYQWDALTLRFPFKIGDVVQKVALARWSRTLSGTVSSGVPILQAIQISGETAGNEVIARAMEDVYESVKKGGTIARPLEEHPLFPPMVSQMVSVGEESGQLDTMLEKIADFYDAEVDAKVKALTSLIEPVMIMVVGGMVGFIVISMYLPIFKLYESIR